MILFQGYIHESTTADGSANGFSNNSTVEINTNGLDTSSSCMNNVPDSDEAWDEGPFCGNGIVEGNEMLDIIGFWNSEEDNCCNFETCTLNPGCACSNLDPCCNNGAIVSAGVSCRASISNCDKEEKCDGISSSCPKNLFEQNGITCTVSTLHSGDASGTCYMGICMSYDYECENVAIPNDYDFLLFMWFKWL